MGNFHTTADIFIIILLAYLALTLVIGARQLYFGKFAGKEEDTETATAGETKSEK